MNTGFYMVLAGILVIAIFVFVISWREDHHKKIK